MPQTLGQGRLHFTVLVPSKGILRSEENGEERRVWMCSKVFTRERGEGREEYLKAEEGDPVGCTSLQ